VKFQVLFYLAILFVAPPALADPVDALVVDQMKVSHLPGVAIAIVDDGHVTKMAGYGDANQRCGASRSECFAPVLLIGNARGTRSGFRSPAVEASPAS
jgi:hypothetical protein